MRPFLLITSLLTLPLFLCAQKVTITGQVLDSQTLEPLIAATIRIDDEGQGTITNLEGKFSAELTEGKHRLIFSFVGYKTDTLLVDTKKQRNVDYRLTSGDITLPIIEVNANEDPAMSIIRLAIRNKKDNLKGLISTEFDAYVKQIVKTDGKITSVEESFLKGFQETGKAPKEFIQSVKKTENMKNSQKAPTSWNVIDFTEDVFKMDKLKVVLPLSIDAFDYYSYQLVNTSTIGNETTYKIQVIPKSRITPLFKGFIQIDGSNYALKGVDLTNADGFSIPFVDEFKILFRQVYANFQGYWIAQHSELNFHGELNFGGLITLSAMDMNQTYTLTSCKVNTIIPNEVKTAQRSAYGGFTTDTVKVKIPRFKRTKKEINPERIAVTPKKAPETLTAVKLEELRPIPLTQDEQLAFQELDSTKTLDKFMKVGGALSGVVNVMIRNSETNESNSGIMSKSLSFLTTYLSFRNNRVEGPYVGLGASYDSMQFDYYSNFDVGYSFGTKQPEIRLGLGYNLLDDHLDRLDLNMYRTVKNWSQPTIYNETVNSIVYTIQGTDNFNYSLLTGLNFGWHKYWTDSLYIKTYLTVEKRENLTTVKKYSLLKTTSGNRFNPISTEGIDKKVSFEFGWGTDPFAFNLVQETQNGLYVKTEISPSWLGSSYDYHRVLLSGQIKINTMYENMFFAPYFIAKMDVAYSAGRFEPFQLYSPDVAMGIYGPFGSYKGLSAYHWAGNQMMSLQMENNWRSVPFKAIHLDGLRDLDLITGFSVLGIRNDTPWFNNPNSKNVYWEANLAMARLFALVRIDAVYNSFHEWYFTIGMSSFF